jgi:hypothetical protein
MKISQLFRSLPKFGYVGDIWKFENAFPMQISSDICKLEVIGETTIYGRGN